MKSIRLPLALLGAVGIFACTASAALVNLGPGSFTPLAPKITFSEIAYGSVNPVYNFTGLPTLGDVTVSFGTYFQGQTPTIGSPRTLTGTPTGPLTLVTEDHGTFIQSDGANPTSPVLSGNPIFNGPISILFSKPVVGVGLDGGYFDALHSTTIQAYDAAGNVLGSITNSQLGIEFYGLADSGGASISGISFYITGPEPAGFAIDNVTFGAKADVIIPSAPDAGSTLVMLGAALAGLLGLARRRF